MKLNAICRGSICCFWMTVSAFAVAEDHPVTQPRAVEQLLEEAASMQRTGRYDAALATYASVLKRCSAGELRIEALWQAARLYDRLAQYDDARTRYTRLLQLQTTKPQAAEVLFALAWIDRRSSQQASARESFQKLVANYPQSAQATEAAYWLAVAAADEKKWDAALGYLDSALQKMSWEAVVPDSRDEQLLTNAICLKAQVAASAGRWQLVISTVEGGGQRLLHAGTAGLQARFWLAEAQYRLGHDDLAKQALLELQPRIQNLDQPWVPMVPLRLAQLAAARRQWTEVLEKTNQIVRNHSDFPLSGEVYYLRGVALAGRGKMTAARQAYRRVLEENNTSHDIYTSHQETAAKAQWMIGETYFHQRDFERARTAYTQVIENHQLPDWQARAALQAGKCWELEGHWQAAHTLYRTALERWQNTQPQPQLQARLKWAERHTTQPTRLQ